MCNVPHINRTKVGRMQHVSGGYCTDLHRAACPVFVCAGLFSASHEARRWRRLNETPRKKQRKKTIEKTNGANKEHPPATLYNHNYNLHSQNQNRHT